MWTPKIGYLNSADNSTVLSYASNIAPNLHTRIMGKSGTGKTTVALSLVLQSASAGRRTILFNTHNAIDRSNMHPAIRSLYEESVRVIHVDEKHPLLIPLFGSRETEMLSPERIVNQCTGILTRTGNLTPSQEARLYQAVRNASASAYSQNGIRIVGSCLRKQNNITADNAYSKLRTLFDYNLIQYGNMFNTDDKLLEIDLNSLAPNEQNLVSQFVLEYIFDEISTLRFRESGGLTVYLDEAQNYDYSKGSTLFQLLNEARKTDTVMILSGTSFSGNSSVTNQCNYQLFFQESEHHVVEKIVTNFDFRLQSQMRTVLRSLPRGRFIAIGNFVEDSRTSNVPSDGQQIANDIIRYSTLYTYFPVNST